MNIALFVDSGIFGPLQNLIRWWITRRPANLPLVIASPIIEGIAINSIGASNLTIRAAGSRLVLRRPLRVVRVVEAGQSRSSVGRMVVSGCMADVCAELDRLAAREAALS